MLTRSHLFDFLKMPIDHIVDPVEHLVARHVLPIGAGQRDSWLQVAHLARLSICVTVYLYICMSISNINYLL